MKINDNFFMKLAIDEAWKYQLLTYPNPAVGAVVVKNGEILSVEAHQKAGESHAEVNALKAAFLKVNPESRLKMIHSSLEIHEFLISNSNAFFEDCTIFTTLEPCNHIGKTPSCAMLLKSVNIAKVVIGIEDVNKTASGGTELLKESNIEVISNVMKKQCDELLFPFIKWQQGTFIFYKMAQTLNGTIDGGYISSNQTLAYVHSLRDKIDLLTIGGNTVRLDKPTLDSRFIQGKNPNVFIYTKNKIFDKSIPLFSIPNREVIISDDLFKLLDYKFVMIEGS
ncbi:MAG: bifunctional diaminohydroxyphosphoribosylaminopyrimidine deaminase/5-amino-6-(5-phosphoribosylamino)uracil reductase RibD, partial [Campylobacteraceae bacterium]|nr:bifunctional diaminohydroxyphosphoribosylaminopyrimidine deaminase/5-amino-6-(5-phosphoribosylamino)uracil reductase RibD [Campylobacteraceae bacterium]